MPRNPDDESIFLAAVRASTWGAPLDDGLAWRAAQALRLRRCSQGSTVCRRGERADTWMGVKSGIVKSMNLSERGKAVTFTGVPAGGWFGEGSLLKKEIRPYDVVAIRDTELFEMPEAVFDMLLSSSFSFNRFIIDQLNERLGQFIAMIEIERLFDPDARTARTLAQLFNPVLYPRARNHLAISQEEIGLLCGLSRGRVNQSLRVLEQERLLRVEYGGVTVLDLEGLRRYDA
jgi:CRP/FNR family transcriptional regulator, cyclic AMP receptor protein